MKRERVNVVGPMTCCSCGDVIHPDHCERVAPYSYMESKYIHTYCPVFPDVHVKLVGENGNAFSILARTLDALHKAGYGSLQEQYQEEATSGDYQHLLTTTMRWVSCDGDEEDDYDPWEEE